jgi:hypothetical protein
VWWLSPQEADLCGSAFLWISVWTVRECAVDIGGAGWSSPVARQAHNLKVVGSNPTPATKKPIQINNLIQPGSQDRGKRGQQTALRWRG